jgi:alpha-tubulin suppressor-like RCC1 family protein
MRSLPVALAILVTFLATDAAAYERVAIDEAGGCALTKDGHVACWGVLPGQVRPRDRAVPLAGLDRVVQLARWGAVRADGSWWTWSEKDPPRAVAGPRNVSFIDGDCVVHDAGKVSCRRWGELELHEGISDAMAVARGSEHICVLRRSGYVACRGASGRGQLGEQHQWRGPADMAGPQSEGWVTPKVKGAIAIAAAVEHSCALLRSGEVRCWGSDYGGGCGDGDDRKTPGTVVSVRGLTDAVALRGYAHSNSFCALRKGGGVACWGYVPRPSLRVHHDEFDAPTAIPALAGARDVAIDGEGICGVLGDGRILCTGKRNVREPTVVPAVNASALSVSGNRSCVLERGGKLKCWGKLADRIRPRPFALPIEDGRALAAARDGMEVCVARPKQVSCMHGVPWDHDLPEWRHYPLVGAVEIANSGGHACARNAAGKVWCFGYEDYGEAGGGTRADKDRVRAIALPKPATALALLSDTSCALAGGELWCWGRDLNGGEQKRGIDNGPKLVATPEPLLSIEGSSHGLLRRTKTGKVLGVSGQESFVGAAIISATIGTACGLMPDASIHCNAGYGSNVVSNVAPIANVVDLGVGDQHACVLRSNGEVRCWGQTEHGALGEGTAPGVWVEQR